MVRKLIIACAVMGLSLGVVQAQDDMMGDEPPMHPEVILGPPEGFEPPEDMPPPPMDARYSSPSKCCILSLAKTGSTACSSSPPIKNTNSKPSTDWKPSPAKIWMRRLSDLLFLPHPACYGFEQCLLRPRMHPAPVV